MSNYDLLKERALVSFELLLVKWGLHYNKIGEYEYDFLSPTRKEDRNLGACRFNIRKGIGADFAGVDISESRLNSLGKGFTRNDLAGFTRFGETKNSFDVIGLVQRIYSFDSYSEAARKLKDELDILDNGKVDKKELLTQMIKREAEIEARRGKSLAQAAKAWSYCVPIFGTIAETYLESRGIKVTLNEPNMKFHPRIYNVELSCFIPCVVFKISKTHDGDLRGIHRIWIAKDGSRKAKLQENKKAIGTVSGNGIWFGGPDKVLYICEGPEEALTIKYVIGKRYVVSTVYSTNYHALQIPDYVSRVILVYDDDKAGEQAVAKADIEYRKQNKEVKVIPFRGTHV